MAHFKNPDDPTNPDRESDARKGSLSAPKLLKLGFALPILEDGDLLLYRKRFGAIAVAGRGIHSHAAMFAWWGDCPMVIETRGVKDARAVTLESQVARYPGRIDVFKADPDYRLDYNRSGAVAEMRKMTGQRYGWLAVWRVAFHHLPFFRWLFRASTDDDDAGTLPQFCSHAFAKAARIGGGIDPVENLADQHTEPADLARSGAFAYRCTLLPHDEAT